MSTNSQPFEVVMRRTHELATPARWWSSGTAVTGIDIIAGPHLGDTTKLFHAEWAQAVDGSLIALLRNHAAEVADLVAAVREGVENDDLSSPWMQAIADAHDRLDGERGYVELPSLEPAAGEGDR